MKKNSDKKFLAMIGGGALITAGVLSASVLGQQQDGSSTFAEPASTGVTVTKSAAPSAPKTAVAVPEIKGPAPLPPEEQGLPG